MRIDNSGRTELASPTSFARRATVSSSFSGSGDAGNEESALRGTRRRGSALMSDFDESGALGGGSDCRCSRSNFSSVLESTP